MDLWIRSQNKEKLVKIDNISYMDTAVDMDTQIHTLWNDCKGILGTYRTKERALEVLDEIQSKLDIFNKFIEEPKDMFKNFFVPPVFIYQMQEEKRCRYVKNKR